MTKTADLESAFSTMEVILKDVEGDPHETLADAAKMLRDDFGAPKTADDLFQNWLALQRRGDAFLNPESETLNPKERRGSDSGTLESGPSRFGMFSVVVAVFLYRN